MSGSWFLEGEGCGRAFGASWPGLQWSDGYIYAMDGYEVALYGSLELLRLAR